MSKKSRRAKLVKPMKQLRQRPAEPAQVHEQLARRAYDARQQLLKGDFAGTISRCESLLKVIPKSSDLRVEVLGSLGMAHTMLQHHQESYDAFSEAISINPTMPELWYNRGLECSSLARPAEAVRNLERAVELTKNDTNEMAQKFARALEVGRLELQEAMEAHEPDITLEQFVAREESFTAALKLMRQEQWAKAEPILRQLAANGNPIPTYWGNLGACLMMQSRFDEAEAAFKHALSIDSVHSFALDNLQKLRAVRLGLAPLEAPEVDLPQEENVQHSLSIYEHDQETASTTRTRIEEDGNIQISTWQQLGKQPPRYDFGINPFKDTRLTTCPQCKIKTRPRKFTLVIRVQADPPHVVIADKICRYCYPCSLLIAHQDQLEELLATHLTMTQNEQLIGNDYQVLGTLDRAEWDKVKQEPLSFPQMVEYLHDFRAVVKFQKVSAKEKPL